MTVVVRADAGVELGIGHIARCSALLRRLDFDPESVVLMTRALPSSIREMVDTIGWRLRLIGNQMDEQADAASTLEGLAELGDVELLVVDHYSLSASWERAVRGSVGRLVVIDDLADRQHSCDVLIDPTPSEDRASRYHELVGAETTLLLGPEYVLLSPEYDHLVPRLRSGEIYSWLVYLGGGTRSHDLEPLLAAFQELDSPEVTMTVVLGRAFVGADEVHSLVESMPQVSVVEWTNEMPQILMTADCAIGATGGAQWERCAAGLPTLTVLTAENQAHDVVELEKVGATRHLGPLTFMTSEDWYSAMVWAQSHPTEIAAMAQAASNIVSKRHTVWTTVRPLLHGKE